MAKAKQLKPSTAQPTSTKSSKVASPLSALGAALTVLGLVIASLAVYLGRNPTLVNNFWGKRSGGKTLEAFGMTAEQEAALPKGANPEGKPHEVKLGDCKDRHAQCVGFAKNDECVKNPGWMIVNCPRSCKACHLLDPKVRCDRRNLNMSTEPIYKPGDMLEMFQSIEANFGDRYGVTVLSTDPYIVTFDNFLTDTEIEALITTVDGGWERSTDTGSANEFGEVGRVLSQGRTSSNAWCRAPCESNPHVQNILKKIGEVTRVPRENYESFQVLRYEIGQAYNPHHDASASQVQLACGPRILTFFLYLSDVEEGGETGFPQFGIKVRPRKGSALLWPSTLNDNPEHIDGRTLHQAHPVVRGTKFAANTWIHLYNFETPNLYGCTGTFSEL
jgi:prolyl 4-hydroxylase